MNTMMQETIASGTARKADIPGWTAAGKTGTSQDFRDAWFIGYTANLVTGVWLGNDDNSPTKKATGGGLPVEVWTRFMRTAHQGVPVASLPNSQYSADRLADISADAVSARSGRSGCTAATRPGTAGARGWPRWLADGPAVRRESVNPVPRPRHLRGAPATKQSMPRQAQRWIASWGLSSGRASRGPVGSQ
jgi:penicillin-binding protein 1A